MRSAPEATPRPIRIAERALSAVMACLLVALMGITFVDVIGRQFGAPLSYAFEFTQSAMGLMIYAGLPLVTARDEHIRVDLFTRFLSPLLRHLSEAILSLLCLGIGIVWARQLWMQAETLAGMNSVMMFTRWPVAPFVQFMSVLAAVTAAIFLFQAVRSLRVLTQKA